MWHLLFLLLPVATACGWYFGYKHSREVSSAKAEAKKIPDNYFVGLNYLINEQPDKAVDAFIKVLAADSDTVEMHLALGNLFRRKGEVDRAIKIHKNLIARPQLTKEQRDNALSELAQDYLRAGVLDRSERLFLELVEIDKENAANYQFLLNLYEKQKDWRQAIATAQKLANLSNGKVWTPLAYYYCALAEEVKTQGLIEQAEVYLKNAITHDKNCVRANIMLGELAMSGEHYKTAIYFLKQVKKQDQDFLSETAPLLAICYEKLGNTEKLIEFLQTSLQENYSASLALFLAKYINTCCGAKAAIEFIAAQNKHGSSLRILDYLLSLCVANTVNVDTGVESTQSSFNGKDKQEQQIAEHCEKNDKREWHEQLKKNLRLALQLLDKLLDGKPFCRCTNCGLGTRLLYWQCPGCRRWATLKPIKRFEID